MSEIIDFSALRLHREKITIAVAGSVQATFCPTGGAPIMPRFDLVRLADELRCGPDWPETDYRSAVFGRATGRDEPSPDDFDPTPHHAEALSWAIGLLDRTQAGLRSRLFGGGKSQ